MIDTHRPVKCHRGLFRYSWLNTYLYIIDMKHCPIYTTHQPAFHRRKLATIHTHRLFEIATKAWPEQLDFTILFSLSLEMGLTGTKGAGERVRKWNEKWTCYDLHDGNGVAVRVTSVWHFVWPEWGPFCSDIAGILWRIPFLAITETMQGHTLNYSWIPNICFPRSLQL